MHWAKGSDGESSGSQSLMGIQCYDFKLLFFASNIWRYLYYGLKIKKDPNEYCNSRSRKILWERKRGMSNLIVESFWVGLRGKLSGFYLHSFISTIFCSMFMKKHGELKISLNFFSWSK